MNDIFEFRNGLVENYKKFSTSFASPRSTDIASKVQAAYDEGRFWPDPLIQINPNYRKGAFIDELARQGNVEPETAQIFQTGKQEDPPCPKPIQLYCHQTAALTMVAGDKSFVVTTGTGSGKSLTFFIPIVNRIIREKKTDSSPRIRAIIVYPMNALANSQFEEIGKFLDGSNLVTVKRYTGQESATERTAIKKNPPDILLTNYVMLDLILTRHQEDHEVVEAAQNLEFLVLDELHTYRGRQGADVAMLVRRIRAQLNADNLLCIGTSATMSSVGSTADRQSAVAQVASKIFDADIPAQQVILEELEYATAKISESAVKAALPARVQSLSQWADLESFRNDPLAVWVEHNLGISRNTEDGKLERAKPVTLHEAAKKLAEDASCPFEVAESALRTFLVAIYATKWEDNKPPFAFKLHQFISGPGQILTTLESPGKRTVELDAQRFAPDAQSQEKRLFPTYFCRFCGEEYIPVWLTSGDSGSPALVKPRELSDNSRENGEDEHSRPGFLCPVESLNADSVFPCDHSATPDEIFERLPDSWFTLNKKGERVLSDGYKDRAPIPLRLLPNGQTSATAGTPYWFLPGSHTWCLNCGQTHGDTGRDTNRLVGLSGEGRSSATTVLTLSALNLMYANGGENSAKLLGFTDNRQDAALQSGHFNEFIFTVTLRSALLRALEQAPDQKIESGEIAALVFNALGFKTTDQAVLAEYLDNPALIGGALRDAQRTLTFMLGYRLHADLGREWRFNNPNLEQLRLVKIGYNWLNEVINSDKLQKSEILASLSVKKRQQFAELVFNHLRKSLCIRSDYFENDEQEFARKKGNGYLLESWRFPSERDHLDDAKDLYLFRNRKADLQQNETTKRADRVLTKKAAVSGSFSSRLFKVLYRGHDGSGASVWRNTQWTADSGSTKFAATPENKAHLFDAVATLLMAANDAGIVEAVNIGSASQPVVKCRLNAGVIVWELCEAPSPDEDKTRADGSIRNRFFTDLYLETARALASPGSRIYRYESHEHTAQVEPELREMLEMRFRNKDKDRKDFADKYPDQRFTPLPVMYCSPTMELGVDISTLDMVYMRNVPPTPANYAQRSGRAGRSGQAALVVTYCTSLSPHDQWFFQRIADMVHGEVCVPALDLANQELIDSHIRAVWMSHVDVDLPVNISDILDMETRPAMPVKAEFVSAFTAPGTLAAAKKTAHRIMERLAATEYVGGRAPWYYDGYENKVIDGASDRFAASFDRWRSLYLSTDSQREKADTTVKNPAVSAQEREIAKRAYIDAVNQINVLLCKATGIRSAKNQDFYLYRYLASEGVLPGYSFPRLPVTAWIPRVRSSGGKTRADDNGTVISRPRFLALSEFGPLSLIYHEGHTFCVRRVKLRAADIGGSANSLTIGTQSVRICPDCGCAQFYDESAVGVSNCPHCGSVLKSEHSIPHLYQVNAVEASVQDRISLMDEERQRRGYDILTVYGFEPGHAPILTAITHDGAKLATFAYAPAAKISRINLGWRRRADKQNYGFWMDPSTGQWTGEDDPERSSITAADGTVKVRVQPQKIVPFVNDHKNALIITPPDDIAGDEEAVATLIAALQRGIAQVFQLESGEVAAEPVPSAAKPRKILVYEASEGGAGALSRLALDVHRAQILAAVARSALETMHYEQDAETKEWKSKEGMKCVAGCYKCLLSYYNQPQHEIIDRRNAKVLAYLKALTKVASEDFAALSAATDLFTATIPKWATGASAFDKEGRKVTFPSEPSAEIRTLCEDKGYEVVVQ